VKYVFNQVIYRKSDDKLCVRAKVDTVVVINGKLIASLPEFDELVEKAIGGEFIFKKPELNCKLFPVLLVKSSKSMMIQNHRIRPK